MSGFSSWRWSWHYRQGWFWGRFDAGPNIDGWNVGLITIWRYRTNEGREA